MYTDYTDGDIYGLYRAEDLTRHADDDDDDGELSWAWNVSILQCLIDQLCCCTLPVDGGYGGCVQTTELAEL